MKDLSLAAVSLIVFLIGLVSISILSQKMPPSRLPLESDSTSNITVIVDSVRKRGNLTFVRAYQKDEIDIILDADPNLFIEGDRVEVIGKKDYSGRFISQKAVLR